MLIVEVTKVPCSRYEGGEGEARVCAVFAYALGLIGTEGIIKLISNYIDRVHDHKGDLVVATKKDLPASWQMSSRRAWVEVGYEVSSNVHFLPVTSKGWEDYWASRRF